MRKFFIKYCTPYRKIIHKLFGIKEVCELNIPYCIYGNFNVNYILYNKFGDVVTGCKTLYSAIKNKGNLGITTIYERY